MDPFGSIATSMLQQSGSNYLERGQEFVKSRMLINSSSLHYHFDVDNEYGKVVRMYACLLPTLCRFLEGRDVEYECSEEQAHDAACAFPATMVIYSHKGAGIAVGVLVCC